jgi:Uma2 family endonuclease
VPIRPRSSYIVEQEGAPLFVLEVVSPESQARDLETKRERYAAIGISEYGLFAPETAEGRRLLEPALQGYRLERSTGEYTRWEPDREGRLFSEVLELWLVERAGALRAQRVDGSWVPTVEEAEAEIRRLQVELDAYRRSSGN